MVGIYKITSPSGKVYIGQSWDLYKRKSYYKGMHCMDQRSLYRSLMKYGFNAHCFEIVHELPHDVSQLTLNMYEILYHDQYRDCGHRMLNLKEPGTGGKHSEETKARMSISRTGLKRPDGIGKKIAAVRKANGTDKRSEAVKAAIRASNLARGFNGSMNPNAKKIQHVESGKVFDTISQAAAYYGCVVSNISNHLKRGCRFKYL